MQDINGQATKGDNYDSNVIFTQKEILRVELSGGLLRTPSRPCTKGPTRQGAPSHPIAALYEGPHSSGGLPRTPSRPCTKGPSQG